MKENGKVLSLFETYEKLRQGYNIVACVEEMSFFDGDAAEKLKESWFLAFGNFLDELCEKDEGWPTASFWEHIERNPELIEKFSSKILKMLSKSQYSMDVNAVNIKQQLKISTV